VTVPLAGTYTRQDIHDVAALLITNWSAVLSIADKLVRRESARLALVDLALARTSALA